MSPPVRWPTGWCLAPSAVVGSLAGTGAWASLGVLDGYTTEAGLVRVAMLPSPAAWLMAVLAGSLTVAAACFAIRRWSIDEPRNGTWCVAPLAGAVVLVVPYLPWIADRLPVLTVLAGPGRWIVWFGLAAEVGRRSVIAMRLTGVGARRLTRVRLPIVAWVVGAIASSAVAIRLTTTPLFPAGDEPHYLVIAQSLWHDGDLAIENNHTRGDYREYFAGRLAPDYLTRGVDEQIYSVHPIGLPLVLAPLYALGGYTAVRIGLIALAALTGALLVVWLQRAGLSRPSVIVGWLAVYASAPFFFFTFTVYPEMLAGLTVLAAMLTMSDPTASRRGDSRIRSAGVGALAGWLLWLSSKYALAAGALILIALGRLWWRADRGIRAPRPVTETVCLLAPFGLSVLAWLGFFFVYWGTPWPSAPYGGGPQLDWSHLAVGAAGLLVDQEYGIVPNAPVYLMAGVGLVAMWRSGTGHRRMAVEVSLLVAALLGTVGAFHMWWGGSAPPGRPLVSVLPLLGLPIAWSYEDESLGSSTRMLTRLLVLLSVALTVTFVVAQEGLLLANHRDGSAHIFEYLSATWWLPAMLPAFLGQPPSAAYESLALWLLGGLAVMWAAHRQSKDAVAPRLVAGQDLVPIAVFVAVSALSLTVPAIRSVEGDPSTPEAGARHALWDHFDSERRPTAVVYDPFRTVTPADALSRVGIVLSPRRRRSEATGEDGFLYDRRVSLPGGSYTVSARLPSNSLGGPVSGTLAVMVGRVGGPFAEWPVTLSRDHPWEATFTLHTEAGFAGIQASPQIATAAPTVVLRASRIQDEDARLAHAQVVRTLHAQTAVFYFLDSNVWVDRHGFWTRQARRTRFLVAPTESIAPVTAADLRVGCGPVANDVTVTSTAGQQSATLSPGERVDVTVPVIGSATLVEVSARSGFVPADLDPDNRDTRDLGCRLTRVTWTPSVGTERRRSH